MDAAGRTVLFAGCTVIIALLGLVVLGLGALQGVALAVALTVLVTMAASLTLLPALLALAGARIERHVRAREAKRRARRGQAGADPADGGRWPPSPRPSRRRPLPVLLAGVAVLVALSAPVLGMRLGFADAGTDPAGSTQPHRVRPDGGRASGPASTGRWCVVAEGGDGGRRRRRWPRRSARRRAWPRSSRPFPAGDGAVATVLAFPETGPQDEATAELVRELRDRGAAAARRPGRGQRYLVGGPTAAALDFADARLGADAALRRRGRRPLRAAAAGGLPLAAGPAEGGGAQPAHHLGGARRRSRWSSRTAGSGRSRGPVEAFVPVMIFAIVFGLSMDYEVFLVSRMHEEWLRTRDPRRAVREGLAATGKVITAAAAIMIVVFAAFVLSPDRMLQQFGLGLAVAVLLDAVVIRCLIVPAVMRLLGARAWWLPGPLARVLPRSGQGRAELRGARAPGEVRARRPCRAVSGGRCRLVRAGRLQGLGAAGPVGHPGGDQGAGDVVPDGEDRGRQGGQRGEVGGGQGGGEAGVLHADLEGHGAAGGGAEAEEAARAVTEGESQAVVQDHREDHGERRRLDGVGAAGDHRRHDGGDGERGEPAAWRAAPGRRSRPATRRTRTAGDHRQQHGLEDVADHRRPRPPAGTRRPAAASAAG